MTNPSTMGRRSAIGLGLATGAAAIAPRRARAQAMKEVKIAMLVPLSGPWARQGILEKFGAAHERAYTFRLDETAVEIVTCQVSATIPLPAMAPIMETSRMMPDAWKK